MDNVAAKERHLELAGVIKDVHAKLRSKIKKGENVKEVWERHCQDKDSLKKYASAMHELATKIWAKNNRETRIEWCQKTCMEYFIGGGLLKVLEKEKRKKKYDESVKTHEALNLTIDNAPLSGIGCDKHKQNNTTDKFVSNEVPQLPKPEIENPCLLTDSIKFPNEYVPDRDNFLKCTQSEGETREESGDNYLESCISGDNVKCAKQTSNKIENLDVPHTICSKAKLIKAAETIQKLLGTEKDMLCSKNSAHPEDTVTLPFECRIRLLDVGSCYNPFEQIPEFISIAVDIQPAVESVFECDFLQLETFKTSGLTRDVIDSLQTSLVSPIRKFPEESVHVVVFSLLLEYLPSALQRWICCKNAHKVLMKNGLLVIITPDSHHQNKNAPRMKSWKLAIESIGFKRWKYIKQEHLHCMAFRKIECEVEKDCSLGDTPEKMLFISQDLKEESIEDEVNNCDNTDVRNYDKDLEFQEGFNELPLISCNNISATDL